MLLRLTVHKVPDIGVEGSKLALDPEEGLSILDGRGDLEPVTYDTGVGYQTLEIGSVIAGDGGSVKLGESLLIGSAFAEDRFPTKTSLGSLKDQELEESAIVMDRNAPFLVMIADTEIGRRPCASLARTYLCGI